MFLDRDGTIIFDGDYISDPAQVKLLPGAAEALTLLRDAGYLLFLFTNQSGVGRGMFPLEAVYRCNERMLELLGLDAPVFADVCIAPESPDQPGIYRKPSPRFINESVTRYQLDHTHTWMVGDKPSDVDAGLNAGIQAALIGARSYPVNGKVSRFESLHAFAKDLTSGEN